MPTKQVEREGQGERQGERDARICFGQRRPHRGRRGNVEAEAASDQHRSAAGRKPDRPGERGRNRRRQRGMAMAKTPSAGVM